MGRLKILVFCVAASVAVSGMVSAATVDFKLVQNSPHQVTVGSSISYSLYATVSDTTGGRGMAFFFADLLSEPDAGDPGAVDPQLAVFVAPFDGPNWALVRTPGTITGDNLISAGAAQDTFDSLGAASAIDQNVGHGGYVRLFDGSFTATGLGTVYVGLGRFGANVLASPLTGDNNATWDVDMASVTSQIVPVAGGVLDQRGFETQIVVPEPATITLVVVGLSLLGFSRRTAGSNTMNNKTAAARPTSILLSDRASAP
jgi:hypothetical protein